MFKCTSLIQPEEGFCGIIDLFLVQRQQQLFGQWHIAIAIERLLVLCTTTADCEPIADLRRALRDRDLLLVENECYDPPVRQDVMRMYSTVVP